MTRFRKKPVVIEAVRNNDLGAVQTFLGADNRNLGWSRNDRTGVVNIVTLEGTMRADWGDWIVRGVQGEFYPVKPDIFAQTYEPIEAPPETPTPSLPQQIKALQSKLREQIAHHEKHMDGLTPDWHEGMRDAYETVVQKLADICDKREPCFGCEGEQFDGFICCRCGRHHHVAEDGTWWSTWPEGERDAFAGVTRARPRNAPSCANCASLQSFELSDDIKTCPTLNIRIASKDAETFHCSLYEAKS
jgi:hypothetical protein